MGVRAAVLARIPSATLLGVDGHPVDVEVHVSNGLPAFAIVGGADAACRESRDRIRAALLSSGLAWPLKRVTVNLAPAGVRKAGAGLDLPILVGLLVAAGEIPVESVSGCAFLGEVGLDGSLRRVPGVVSLVDALDDAAAPRVIVPSACAGEAGLVGRHDVRAASTVVELLAALRGEIPWRAPAAPPAPAPPAAVPVPDLADVRGHPFARLALEVAAAGRHHLLLVGPPGSGKTMLATRLPGLLPSLDGEAALTATRIHSAAGLPLPADGLVRRPPFRAPHHSSSAVSLVGGGTAAMRPGEISLASGGVLFLDELGEFRRDVLDQLRQPLEEGIIRVARANFAVAFPARFLLVAAMNPCPCGRGGPPGWCACPERLRARYAARVSGPLLDRFDLRVAVDRPEVGDLLTGPRGEPTVAVAARVAAARARAAARGGEAPPIDAGALALLDHVLRTGRLSARGLQRVRRVAGTVADLAGHEGALTEEHVSAALGLRADHVLEAVS